MYTVDERRCLETLENTEEIETSEVET